MSITIHCTLYGTKLQYTEPLEFTREKPLKNDSCNYRPVSSLLLAKIQNKFLGALSRVSSFLRKYIIKPKTTKSGHKMRNRAKKSAKEDL